MAKRYSSPLLRELKSQIDPKTKERTKVRMKISAWIEDQLKEKGWTKKELAERLEQHPSVVTKWLSGTHNFTSDTLADIQRVFGKPLFSFVPENKVFTVKMVLQQSIKAQTSSKASSYSTWYDILKPSPKTKSIFESHVKIPNQVVNEC
jgi:transcriptional regulator with XRE-family HTH domain